MRHREARSGLIPGSEAQALLAQIATWGNTTTVIVHGGSVFEFKGPFPHGVTAQGYYNLQAPGGVGFEGHLDLDRIEQIRFQSRNHRGRPSLALCFEQKSGEVVFKVFVGRDQDGELIAAQVQAFNALQRQYDTTAQTSTSRNEETGI